MAPHKDDHYQFEAVEGQPKAGVYYLGEVESPHFPNGFQMPGSEAGQEVEKRQTILRSYWTLLLSCPSAP